MTFEKLREMESFTDDMFNRIVEFQERKHPAWDPEQPFDERIRNLPLHYLIFSNADRDPAKYSHTVAPYYPLHEETRKIAAYARLVADEPVIADLHAGNGFVGSLIAREGVRVIGVRDPQAKPNQIEDFYDEDCYEVCRMALMDIDFPFDVAFSSWMPANENWTPVILRHKPKLIVFVYTEHIDNSGRPQTGTPEAFTSLPDNYRPIDAWSLTRPRDVLHEVWPDLTSNIEETRHVRIYAAEPYHDIQLPEDFDFGEPYDWERELEMALLALEAKNTLRSQGAVPRYY